MSRGGSGTSRQPSRPPGSGLGDPRAAKMGAKGAQGTPKAQKDPKKEPGNMKIHCCKVTEACQLHMIEACKFKTTCKLHRIEPCTLTKHCNLHMIGACTFTKHCKTHGIGTPASTKTCNLHMIRTARGKTFGDAQSRNGRPGRAPDIVIYI